MAKKKMKTLCFGTEDTYVLTPDFENLDNVPECVECLEETLDEIDRRLDTLENEGGNSTWEGVAKASAYNSDTLTSDGVNYGGFHKVSDVVPTLAEIKKGGTIDYYRKGEAVKVDFLSGMWGIAESENGAIINNDGLAMVIVSFNGKSKFGALTYPAITEPGVYFKQDSNYVIRSLTINEYKGFPSAEFVKIPNKYLGILEDVNADTLMWNGDIGDRENIGLWEADDVVRLIHVSDNVPTLEELNQGGSYYAHFKEISGIVYDDDQVYEFNGDVTFAEHGDCIYDETTYIVIAKEDNSVIEESGIVLPKKGIYFTYIEGSGRIDYLTINGYTGFSESVIKEEYLPEGIGGGSDWNAGEDEKGYIANKPFKEVEIISNELTWDGNTDGVYNVMGMFYHVSESIPTLEELQQGGTITFAGADVTFDATSVMDLESLGAGKDCYIIMGSGTYVAGVVLKEGATATLEGFTVTFDKAGVYFLHNAEYGVCTSKLIINDYNFTTTAIETLDVKYLPKSHQFGETTVITDALTWDGNTDGLYSVMGLIYHVSDNVPTLEELNQGGMGYLNQDGTVEEIPFDDGSVTDTGTGIIIVADYVYVVSEDGATLEDGLTFEKRGIYFPNMSGAYVEKMTINNYKFSITTVQKIDPKFIDLSDFKTTDNMGDCFVELASDTISWDLDVEGRTIFTLQDSNGTEDSIEFVHVSDAVPTLADLQNGGTLRNIYQENSVMDFTIDDINDLSELLPGAYGCSGFAVLPIPIGHLPKGVYLNIMRNADGEIVVGLSELTINGYMGFVKRKLNNPIDTPVKSIAGIEPSANGDVPIKSLTPLIDPEITGKVVRLEVTATTDDDGTTTYRTTETYSGLSNLLVTHDVVLVYEAEYYRAFSKLATGQSIRFINMALNDTGLTIKQFNTNISKPYVLTYKEKTIQLT